jgi:hypothetical protein
VNIELTLTSVVMATLYYALYLSSGFVSISLCKKYSSIKKYFSKQYAPTYLIGLFIFVYMIIPTDPPFAPNKLAMPIVSLVYVLVFSILGCLFYKRFKIRNFFNAEFFQYLTGVIIFTVLNTIRVYVQYAWLN